MNRLSNFQRWWMNSWMHRARVRIDVRRFLSECPDHFRGEVLEVGAGFGFSSRRILETFPQVELTATDIDPEASYRFDRLKNIYGSRLKLQPANVLNLPFDRASFDIVIAINVLHYFTPDEVKISLLQMLRVLRPGGTIGISDHVHWLHPHRTYVNLIREVLESENCDIVSVKGNLNYDIWARKASAYSLKGGA